MKQPVYGIKYDKVIEIINDTANVFNNLDGKSVEWGYNDINQIINHIQMMVDNDNINVSEIMNYFSNIETDKLHGFANRALTRIKTKIKENRIEL